MAGYRDKKPYGERVPTRTDTEKPPAPSPIPCLPYFPVLRPELGSTPAVLLFTYLEIYFPTPQDPEIPLRGRSFAFNLGVAGADLQLSRRTLRTAFYLLSSWFETEDSRFAAARAAREFLPQRRNYYLRQSLYSVVGPKSLHTDVTYSVRRNHHAIQDLVRIHAIPTIARCELQALPYFENVVHHTIERARLLRSSPLVAQKKALADILTSPSVLSGDRRRVRYGRLREAVERGLAGEEALKAKQVKGFNRKRGEKRPSPIVSEAVDPEFRPSDGTLLD